MMMMINKSFELIYISDISCTHLEQTKSFSLLHILKKSYIQTSDTISGDERFSQSDFLGRDLFTSDKKRVPTFPCSLSTSQRNRNKKLMR